MLVAFLQKQQETMIPYLELARERTVEKIP
jgi:hypothetical protein